MEIQETLLLADSKKSFSRASNLIWEAIDVDGVAFFDENIGSFGSRSTRGSMNEEAPVAATCSVLLFWFSSSGGPFCRNIFFVRGDV